jgi:hypothetical protein
MSHLTSRQTARARIHFPLDLRDGPRPVASIFEQPLLHEPRRRSFMAFRCTRDAANPDTQARRKQWFAAWSSRSKRSVGCGNVTFAAPHVPPQCMTNTSSPFCQMIVRTTIYYILPRQLPCSLFHLPHGMNTVAEIISRLSIDGEWSAAE